jgi:hypothetical protein
MIVNSVPIEFVLLNREGEDVLWNMWMVGSWMVMLAGFWKAHQVGGVLDPFFRGQHRVRPGARGFVNGFTTEGPGAGLPQFVVVWVGCKGVLVSFVLL